MFIDGMFLGNILLVSKLADRLKGELRSSVHVQKSKYLFSDFLLILLVKTPTHIYLSNHIL